MTTLLVVESDPDISECLTDVVQTELAAVVRSASTGLGAAAIETAAGLRGAMDESHRLMQESRALLTRRSSTQTNRLEPGPGLGQDTAIPPDAIGEWLSRLTHRSNRA